MKRICILINLILLIILGMCHSKVWSQQFINGSFEESDFPCRFALGNGGFTTYVKNTIAFGKLLRGLDMYRDDCGPGPAADGRYYISMRIEGDRLDPSIIGLELNKPFIKGNSYTISFYHKAANRFAKLNWLQFGLSNEAFIFGPIIEEIKGKSEEEGWVRSEFQFVAPVTAKYLTIKIKFGYGSKFYLDNFSVACPTELHLGNDTTICAIKDELIQAEGSFDSYRWQDNSIAPTYNVRQPGLYWVEVTRDDCIIRDTIIMKEYEYNCQCEIYLPNVFSPNLDGINDFFNPMTPCEFVNYEFKILNRWGQLLFHSSEPHEGWDGSGQGFNASPNGVYLYFLRYQFSYQESPKFKSGTITILK